tara:strand:- start:7025 stop:7519 length:495 start_codon:yes stop_codon:yes gene_type:complete
MVITYQTSEKITFPAFPLISSNYVVADGLVTIDGMLVDDRNMEGESLGRRRLITPYQKLFPLKRSVNTLIGLIKRSRSFYIDCTGLIFTYEKIKWVRLKYRKIEKIVPKGKASLLFIHRWKAPFIIPRPPPEEVRYVGILHLNEEPWLLYDYATAQLKDTRRKI